MSIVSYQEDDWRVTDQRYGSGQFSFVAATVRFAWFVGVAGQRKLLDRPGYNLMITEQERTRLLSELHQWSSC